MEEEFESDEIHTTSNVPSKGFTKKDLTIINSFECFTRIIPKAWRNIPECLVQAFLTTVKDFKNLSTNLTIIDNKFYDADKLNKFHFIRVEDHMSRNHDIITETVERYNLDLTNKFTSLSSSLKSSIMSQKAELESLKHSITDTLNIIDSKMMNVDKLLNMKQWISEELGFITSSMEHQIETRVSQAEQNIKNFIQGFNVEMIAECNKEVLPKVHLVKVELDHKIEHLKECIGDINAKTEKIKGKMGEDRSKAEHEIYDVQELIERCDGRVEDLEDKLRDFEERSNIVKEMIESLKTKSESEGVNMSETILRMENQYNKIDDKIKENHSYLDSKIEEIKEQSKPVSKPLEFGFLSSQITNLNTKLETELLALKSKMEKEILSQERSAFNNTKTDQIKPKKSVIRSSRVKAAKYSEVRANSQAVNAVEVQLTESKEPSIPANPVIAESSEIPPQLAENLVNLVVKTAFKPIDPIIEVQEPPQVEETERKTKINSLLEEISEVPKVSESPQKLESPQKPESSAAKKNINSDYEPRRLKEHTFGALQNKQIILEERLGKIEFKIMKLELLKDKVEIQHSTRKKSNPTLSDSFNDFKNILEQKAKEIKDQKVLPSKLKKGCFTPLENQRISSLKNQKSTFSQEYELLDQRRRSQVVISRELDEKPPEIFELNNTNDDCLVFKANNSMNYGGEIHENNAKQNKPLISRYKISPLYISSDLSTRNKTSSRVKRQLPIGNYRGNVDVCKRLHTRKLNSNGHHIQINSQINYESIPELDIFINNSSQ